MGVLYELHHLAVFRTAYGILRSYDLAEDVTQQVFIEVFSSIKRYDLRRPFPPWLHRIAVHRGLDEIRRRKDRFIPIEAAGDLPSPYTSPEQTAEDSELRAAIRKAMGDLDPKHRAAIVLRYYQGFSEAEMAIALHCRRGTVKSRLNKARHRLREILVAQASSINSHRPAQPELLSCGERGDLSARALSPEEEQL